MKKILSILLAALLLCTAMGVGLAVSAAPAPGLLTKPLTEFLANVDPEQLTDVQVGMLIEMLKTLKTLNVNYVPLIEAVDDYLPYTVKAALHDAGLMDYPIWERDAVMHFIFKYLLFGWIWMEQGNSQIFPFALLGQLL